LADVYVCTDWKGLAEYSTIAVVEVGYYAKTRGVEGADVARFDARDLVPNFEIPHMERVKGEGYEALIDRMAHELAEHPSFMTKSVELVLGIDDTGMAIEYFLEELDEEPVLMSISATGSVSRLVDGVFMVPRHELITALASAYRSGLVRTAADLELIEILDSQLVNLRIRTDTGVTINRNSQATGYDDLVRAVGMGVWKARQDHETEKTYADRLQEEFSAPQQWDVFSRYKE